MLAQLWFEFLYQPLFNGLILIYNTIAHQNLGWAVVWLTVFLRVVLLPLTIISELSVLRQKKAIDEAKKVAEAFKGDRVAQQEAVRRVIKKYHISPWAKVLALLIQLLVLVLLYQVFLQGITGQKVFKILYPSVDFPGKINTSFYGFEIGQRHDFWWAGAAALYLLFSIMIESRGKKKWDKSEMYYLIFFPLFTFAVLWYLPMVKSLFILTTMIFSSIIILLRIILLSLFKTKPKGAGH